MPQQRFRTSTETVDTRDSSNLSDKKLCALTASNEGADAARNQPQGDHRARRSGRLFRSRAWFGDDSKNGFIARHLCDAKTVNFLNRTATAS
jgi:hypothetical protein